MALFDTISMLWDQRPTVTADDSATTQIGLMHPDMYGDDNTHPLNDLWKSLSEDSSRIQLYSAYSEMEEFTPEVGKALDFHADYAASGGTTEGASPLIFRSKNGQLDRRLARIDEVVQIGKQAWPIIRGMCRDGDEFYENIFTEGGLAGLRALPKATIFRLEDEYGELQGFEQRLKAHNERIEFEDFQVSHFRLRTDESMRYGRSILWSLRRLTMELALMDQAMTIERLSNAHRRLKHKIDVGSKPDEDQARKAVALAKSLNRRIKTINPRDGKMRLKYNPLRAEEDVFVVTYPNSTSDVEVLESVEAGKHTKDMDMKWNRLFAGLGVPQSWYGLTGPNVRAVIKDQALNFMRAVRRIRRDFEREAIKPYQIGLMYSFGVSWEKVWRANIGIAWPQMSHADDLLSMELEELRGKVAKMHRELQTMSRHDILTSVFQKSDDEATGLIMRADEDPTIGQTMSLDDPSEDPMNEPKIQIPDGMLEELISEHPHLKQHLENIQFLIDEIEHSSQRYKNGS